MRTKGIIAVIMLLCLTIQANAQKLTREQYINKYKDVAIKQMHKHKIPASIILAQACLESDNGNSTLARKANNHFGIKCHDGWKGKKYRHNDDSRRECFRSYDTPIDSYTDHSYFLTSGSRYNSLFDLPITDYKGWAHGLKAAGYATNPKYARLLIDIIEEYSLYKYDNGEAYTLSKAEAKKAKKEARVENKRIKLEAKLLKLEKKAQKAERKLQKYNAKHPIPAENSVQQENNIVPQTNIKEPVEAYPTANEVKYTIKPGDTLYSIARTNGTTVEEILKNNPGIKASELKIGSEIKIR